MIKKLLGKFGFIHESELTEEYLCLKLGKFVGDPTQESIDDIQEKNFFRDLARLDGTMQYLRSTMARDMQRDFGSTNEQRQLIRGAFARTAYWKGKIIESNKNLK